MVELKGKPKLQWDGRLDIFLASFCSEREQKRSLSLVLSSPPEDLQDRLSPIDEKKCKRYIVRNGETGKQDSQLFGVGGKGDAVPWWTA